MTLTAVALCAATAVVLILGGTRRRAVSRLDQGSAAGPHPAAARRPRRLRGPLLWIPVAALVLVVAWLVQGPRAAAYIVLVIVPVATVVSLARSRRKRSARTRAETEVARACGLVAAEVRAGRAAEAAVGLVAGDCPVLARAAAALLVGDDVVRTWRAQALEPGCAGLLDLARAWEVSQACGAPMGPSLDQVAGALERDAEVSRLVRAELASAQATGQLMAVLPVVGIGLGYSIGGRPVDFLLHTTVGLACSVAAVVLASIGALWTRALARSPGRED